MMRTDLLWADVKITNRKGLLRTLNEEFETEYPSLEDALELEYDFHCQESINGSGTVQIWTEGRQEYSGWKMGVLAPYVEGSFAWAGEDGTFWKDKFEDNTRKVYPGRIVFADEEEEDAVQNDDGPHELLAKDTEEGLRIWNLWNENRVIFSVAYGDTLEEAIRLTCSEMNEKNRGPKTDPEEWDGEEFTPHTYGGVAIFD